MKSGVLYNSQNPIDGEVEIAKIIRFLKSAAWILRKVGLVMMGISAIGLFLIYLPLMVVEVRYGLNSVLIKSEVKEKQPEIIAEVVLSPTPTAIPTPSWTVPDPEYSVYIPKIEAISKVIADVDAANAVEYQKALKLGVAEALGLSHPGEMGTTFLFAHSVGSRVDFARYNAVFYLLDKLESGDRIEVMYKNNLLTYEVVGREILLASDLQYLVPQQLVERLVLQTCYPPGTTWKRLVVVAKRV